ncbi:uncharacterized protein BP01DRAFT_8976 [Aspergillus saccharolyticus JOP 1030-1]|uniref:Uncharacterized protein n=1 Tax=Aspergillus saccharolyticus JOP 1030-1 TaxID=1450539 RepID=A0A318ZQL6_9EURO|nr:hypothetical protein BP01DRAFT_8976 [Aspergillus saccharolyticus JOP 1030-1]PYH49909.1 hypothetical protein BP01DRAFT_8976 [Aspergillus saccharolyticus JOP 1030-1]
MCKKKENREHENWSPSIYLILSALAAYHVHILTYRMIEAACDRLKMVRCQGKQVPFATTT